MEQFPDLKSASSFEDLEITFKPGGSFKGYLKHKKKTGKGLFIWANKTQYEGEYADDMRFGFGCQTWFDGSTYSGEFVEDRRHGIGKHTWANGEIYEGDFFMDQRHGKGRYFWPDIGEFEGLFYLNKKEGYGTFRFMSGDVFQGLYKDDREGPGVLSYSDGCLQDVGLWHGKQLIKICFSLPGAFTINKFPNYYYDLLDNTVFFSTDNCWELPSSAAMPLDLPNIFGYLPKDKISEKAKDIFNDCTDPESLAVNHEMFKEEFLKSLLCNEYENIKLEDIPSWNLTPSMIELQKHTVKHSGSQSLIPAMDIIQLNRSQFKEKGIQETRAEELLLATMAGDLDTVTKLLNNKLVHPDVGDRHGHTALIGASVDQHCDIIDSLLDNGADVNKLNDEGCSALMATILQFYPPVYFVPELVSICPGIFKQAELDVADSLKVMGENENILSAESREITTDPATAVTGEQTEAEADFDRQSLPEKAAKDHISVASIEADKQVSLVNSKDMTEKDKKELVDANVKSRKTVEFDSNKTTNSYSIVVTDTLVDQCAAQLAKNDTFIVKQPTQEFPQGTAEKKAVEKLHRERCKNTIHLLLRRGANPNASKVPFPVLLFSVLAADVDMVKELLMKGALPSYALPEKQGGLTSLHLAATLPGEKGVEITELLLNALADPNIRATKDKSYLNKKLIKMWSDDPFSMASQIFQGGRTALHIACAREDNYIEAHKIVRLLLDHKADPNLLCNGWSPLVLAIASGNDLAISELLAHGADASLPLTCGLESALCAASSPEYEHHRSLDGRIHLINKLMKANANILAPIPIGPKRETGTVVDYAHYLFNLDQKIANTPYHALTATERETLNARKKNLVHLGNLLRSRIKELDRERAQKKLQTGQMTTSLNYAFLLGDEDKSVLGLKASISAAAVAQGSKNLSDPLSKNLDLQRMRKAASITLSSTSPMLTEKLPFKYCYDCGRIVGVKLVLCACKEVYFCSKACKINSWNLRHKSECRKKGGAKSIKVIKSDEKYTEAGLLYGENEMKEEELSEQKRSLSAPEPRYKTKSTRREEEEKQQRAVSADRKEKEKQQRAVSADRKEKEKAKRKGVDKGKKKWREAVEGKGKAAGKAKVGKGKAAGKETAADKTFTKDLMDRLLKPALEKKSDPLVIIKENYSFI